MAEEKLITPMSEKAENMQQMATRAIFSSLLWASLDSW